MLLSLISLSLRYRSIVIGLAIALLAVSLYQLPKANFDVFPEFASSQVDIQTEVPGLSPEQVELLVTQPIENAVTGLPNVLSVRSNSVQGLSVISLVFKNNNSIFQDRQVVAERLAGISLQLPQGSSLPIISPLTSSAGDLMSIGLTSSKLSLDELRTLVDWTIEPRLLAIPGVAKVGVFGGRVQQIEIRLKLKKLIEYGLSIQDVISVAQKITGVRGAGFIDTEAQRIIIQTEGQLTTRDKIAGAALVKQGSDFPVSTTIGDIADVMDGFEPPLSSASIMGTPGIVLNVWAQYQANTLHTTTDIDAGLQELAPLFAANNITVRTDLFRSEKFIRASLLNIKTSIETGALLVIVVLILFLLNWRTAFISCTAIPLSILGAITLLSYCGLTLNTMTLGGLAIALGEVVDDAVIDVENILRRLRQVRSTSKRRITEVILKASLEVRSAVVFGTLAVCFTFIPVLTMEGLAGKLFAPLGIAYIFAISFSLLVAITVTPALCSLLLNPKNIPIEEPKLIQNLKRIYSGILRYVEKAPAFVTLLTFTFILAGIALIPQLKGSFLPSFKEDHFIVHMSLPPGTSLDESLKTGNEATTKLKQLSWVKVVAQRVGRAASDDTFGTNESELEIELDISAPRNSKEQIRMKLEEIEGPEFEINSFLDERIQETLSGSTAPIVVHVFGKNFDAITKRANEVKTILESLSGAVDVRLLTPPGAPFISVKLRAEALSKWGFDASTVLDSISALFQGVRIGQVYDGNRVFNVSVTSGNATNGLVRDRIKILQNLPLQNPVGTYVALHDLADISEVLGRTDISHEQGQRVQTVQCGIENRDLRDFLDELTKKVNADSSIADTYVSIVGAGAAAESAKQSLFFHSILATAGLLLLLSIALGGARNLLVVGLNLPVALVGGIFVSYFGNHAVSMGSLVGFVTLFGITLRNSIMMISHYSHLVLVEGKQWNKETAIQGASERLIPIIMTALVTGLGLLPLALHSDVAGHEIEGPMATVILGGLITSTVLNLLILPALAARFCKFETEASTDFAQ